MRRIPVLAQIAGLALLIGTPVLMSQEANTAPARLRLLVPATAAVEFEGAKTRQTGTQRDFVTPPLGVGQAYFYNVKLTYINVDGKQVVENHRVRVVGGQQVEVDLRPRATKLPVTPEEKKQAKTTEPPPSASERPDVPYVPTPQEVVDRMLEMANVTDDDVVYDLGCGDGRIVVTAAKKYKAKGVGIDINPKRVAASKENVKKARVEKRVEIRQGNIFKVPDLSKATVVTMYLLPEVNLKLMPILKKQLKPGTRIVSHDFDMGDWKPLQEATVADKGGIDHQVYLWMIGAENKGPIKKEEKKPANKETKKAEEPKKEARKEEKKEEPVKEAKEVKRPRLDVPWVPTPQEVVDKMLELGKVGKNDVLYDLGCGDGRIVVTAAKKFGCKAVGIDLDPVRVKESREAVKKAGVEKLVEIREGNALKVADIGKASIVTLYLLPEVNLKLRPILQKELKPGSRIVSHDFDMGDWKPVKEIEFKDNSGDKHDIYLWNIEGKKAGARRDEAPKERIAAPTLARADEKKKDEDKEPDVIFVPTPQAVVDKMLELAKVKKGDVVYDLGCGDGRIPVTAAKKFGCKAFGFDVDPQRIKESNENVKKNKVGDLVTITKKDIFTLDLSPANVVTLYLLPRLNVKLIPQLDKLKPGSRIVSHDFDMEGVKPDDVVRIKAKDDLGNEREHTIYVFTVPLKKEKKGAFRAPEAKPTVVALADEDKTPDVIYVPTPQGVVDKMLELAKVKKDDVVYDLGCGDGRIPVTAAKKFGCKAFGFDVDPQRIKESNENVKKNKVEKLVTITKKDIFTLDLSPANVVTLYLLPSLNVKLIPQLDKLKPGSRIVTHDFDMRGVKPDQVIKLNAKDDRGNEREHTIYVFSVPLKKEKE